RILEEVQVGPQLLVGERVAALADETDVLHDRLVLEGVLPVDADGPGAAAQGCQHRHQRRLAGTVAAQQAVDAAGCEVEVDTRQCGVASIAQAEARGVDSVAGHRPSLVLLPRSGSAGVAVAVALCGESVQCVVRWTTRSSVVSPSRSASRITGSRRSVKKAERRSERSLVAAPGATNMPTPRLL